MIYVIIVHFFPGAMGLSTAIGFMLYFYYAISTYFYKPQRTALENIKRRVKQLLVPMAEYIVGLNILSYLYMWARGIGNPTVRGCIHSMWLIFKGTRTLQDVNHMQMTADPAFSVFTPYYFLELLFVSSVVFYLVAGFALKKFSRMCWVSLSLIVLSCIIVQVRSITWIWMAEFSFGIAGMMLWGAGPEK